MMLEGKVTRTIDRKFWEVEVRPLEIYTQGKTKKDALALIKDAIEVLVDKKDFKVEVVAEAGENFKIRANDTRTLIALLLERQRQVHGLSVREVVNPVLSFFRIL